jgi:predicted nucleic acid-binding protein
MIVYLDTSTVLRIVLAQPNPLASWGEWERAYTSEILGVEARRTLDRLRLESALDDEGIVKAQEELMKIEAHLGRIPVTRPVLRRAAQPMATVVKTLDAIHIASALMLEERLGGKVLFATHDVKQAAGARAMGFGCEGIGAGRGPGEGTSAGPRGRMADEDQGIRGGAEARRINGRK